MEWMNNKIGEAEKWHFAFMGRHATFNDLMSKEPKPPTKPTNEHKPITWDTLTPEKPKQDFDVMDEDDDYALSLDLGQDMEEDFWKTVYFPLFLGDDSDVAHMFSVMVENNALHLYV